MNITAVKFRRKGHPDLTGFRIPSPTGERRNFAVYLASVDEIEHTLEAIRFGLSGNKKGSITHAAIQMVADNGDTWVIERGPGHLRANCNGQDYAFNTESELWHKILDFDPSSYQTNDQSFELFHILDLNARGDHLEASPKRHQHQLTPLRSINQVIDGLQSDIQQAFRASPQVSMSDLVLLAQNLEPLYGEWRILEQLRARRINSFDGFALAKAEEAIHRLRQEVKILEDIQREAHHILDPSFAPSALRDRLSSIAERQNELRQELEAAELPAKFHDIPWEQVLSILGRLHAFHHFWQATEQVWSNGMAQLPLAIENHRKAIQEFAANDHEILQDFEDCLAQLGDVHPEPGRVDDETNGTLGKLIDRFKSKPQLRPNTFANREKRGTLELARNAVENALQKLSEVNGNLAAMNEAKDSACSDLDKLRSRLNQDYCKIKMKWQELCTHWKLPVNLSLKTGLGCLLLSAELGKLNYEEAQIELKLNMLREQALTLEPLIREWRRLIGSAKSTPTDTLSLLITETRSACDMLPKKSAILARASGELADRQALQSYLSELEKQREDLRIAWAKAFLDRNYAVVGLSETNWSEIFAKVRAMDLLQAQVDRSQDKLVDHQIFAQSLAFWPLTIFTWSGFHGQNRERLKLLELIDQAPNDGHALLFVSEPTIADMLLNMGLPKAITLNNRQSAAESQERRPSLAPQQTSVTVTEDDIGDKARAALAMLQGLGLKTHGGQQK